MRKLIYRSCLALGQTPHKDEAETAIALSFAEALTAVPTERFETLYQRAMANKRDTFALSVTDLLSEWDVLREELRRDADTARMTVLRLEAGRCATCDGARWLVDRSNPKHPVLRQCETCGGSGRGGDAASY